ncbi:MAG: hypothetical protein IJL27_04015, partial [Firmicutes bacterium]|nr:hypothetical protein [Bacillota bacterium]
LSAWLGSTAIGTFLGGSLGGVSFGRAKSTMKEPRTKTAASEYISAFRLLGQSDNYLYTTTSRVYDPPSRSSSGGGSSGGHSSYSSSFHSSSGASHSSSGRKF